MRSLLRLLLTFVLANSVTWAAAKVTPKQAQSPAQPKKSINPKDSLTKIAVRTGLHPTFLRYTFEWPHKTDVKVIKDEKSVTLKFPTKAQLYYPKPIHKEKYIDSLQTKGSEALIVIIKTKVATTFRSGRAGHLITLDVQKPLVQDFDNLASQGIPTQGKETPLKRLKNIPPPEKPLGLMDSLGNSTSVARDAQGNPIVKDNSSLNSVEGKKEDPLSISSYLARLSQETAEDAKDQIRVRPGTFGRYPALVIKSKTPIGMGAIVRAGRVFVTMQTDKKIELPNLPEPWSKFFNGITLKNEDGGQVLRFIPPSNIYVHLFPMKNKWILTFEKHRAFEVNPVEITWVNTNNKTDLKVLAADLKAPIHFKDPETGYTLKVFGVTNNQINVSNRWQSASIELLPSVFGVAFLVKDYDVVTGLGKEGVTISHKHRLPISPLEMTQLQRQTNYSASQIIYRGSPRTYDQNFEQTMMGQINYATGEARSELYENLAIYYLDRGYFSEALTNTRLATDISNIKANDATAQALKGMLQVLVNPSALSMKSIFGYQSSFVEDVILWRGVLAYYRDDNRNAMRLFSQGAHLLAKYPPVLKNILLLYAAEVALELEKTPDAYLVAVNYSILSAEQRLHLRLLEGWKLENMQKHEDAIAIYKQLAASDSAKYSVYAGYRLAKLEYKTNKITAETLIKRLEDLRYRWFGDKIQLKILKYLGTTYIDNGFYSKGLRILLYTMKNLGHISNMRNLYKLTSDGVYKGFSSIKDEAGLKRSSFFNEFRALIPDDERREEIMKLLIDTLIELDLLPNAIGLMSAEVESPSAENRDQKLLELGKLYIMNNNHEQALKTLDRVLLDQLSDADLREHFILRARALILKRDFVALDQWLPRYVDDLSTYDLRGDSAWLQGKWDVAMKEYKTYLQNLAAEAPLNDKLIMRFAVAALNAHDKSAQTWVREVYSDKMKASPYKAAFEKITDTEQTPDTIGQALIINQSKDTESYTRKVYESILAEIGNPNMKEPK